MSSPAHDPEKACPGLDPGWVPVFGKDHAQTKNRQELMLVDSHCHLDFPDFAGELDAVVARARTAGIGRIVTISTRIKQHANLIGIAERFPDVFCSVGTHPHHAHEELDIGADDIVARTRHPKVVAIGEAGLDYHYDFSPRDAQERGFRAHIAAARETQLPLVIHTREADDDTAKILEEETGKGPFPAVLHCYTGGHTLAQRAIALGLHISFTGILTFKKSDELRAIAAGLPHDRVLVETDAPYLAPGKFRGKRNEPAYVTETAKVLAEVQGVSADEVARQTTENFFKLFSKVPREQAHDPEKWSPVFGQDHAQKGSP
jgi:TatD DNase family protein